MTMYYVHLEPDGTRDDEGEDLPDVKAAIELGERVAADLMRNREEALPYQMVVVTDITGATVCETPLILH
jgi:uncharacterized protein DUF6894